MSESEQELLSDGKIRITLVEKSPLPGRSGPSTRAIYVQPLKEDGVDAAKKTAEEIGIKAGELANVPALKAEADDQGRFYLSVPVPGSGNSEAQDIYTGLKQAAMQVAKNKKHEAAPPGMPISGDIISDDDLRKVMGQYSIPISPEYRIKIARDLSRIVRAKQSGDKSPAPSARFPRSPQ